MKEKREIGRKKGITDKKQEEILEENKTKIINAIFSSPNKYKQINPKEIVKKTGLSRMTVWRHLKRLGKEGSSIKDNFGVLEHEPFYIRTLPKNAIKKILEEQKGNWRINGNPEFTGITTIYRLNSMAITEDQMKEIREILMRNIDFSEKKDEQSMITFIITKKRNRYIKKKIFHMHNTNAKINAKRLKEKYKNK